MFACMETAPPIKDSCLKRLTWRSFGAYPSASTLRTTTMQWEHPSAGQPSIRSTTPETRLCPAFGPMEWMCSTCVKRWSTLRNTCSRLRAPSSWRRTPTDITAIRWVTPAFPTEPGRKCPMWGNRGIPFPTWKILCSTRRHAQRKKSRFLEI